MPTRGRYAELDNLPGPSRDLAEAVRDLCATINISLTGISRELDQRGTKPHVSRSVLSDLINGKRKRPKSQPLKALHDLACERASNQGIPIRSWDDLEKLRRSVVEHTPASVAPCAHCPATISLPVPTGQEEPPFERPAASGVEARDVLPVPLGQGDRQHVQGAGAPWPDLDDVSTRLAAGDLAGAAGILRHIGLEATLDEAALAIASSQHHGLVEATELLLQYASQRKDREVIGLARKLLDRDQQLPAGILLGLALDA
ncbi:MULTISPECIES: hypothetical protein [unclassified Streptomyces]|uniref:hypothetical protein n=1 Tax=unclassified Streptomyces TaxID=2593676 RepID=UPI0037F49732